MDTEELRALDAEIAEKLFDARLTHRSSGYGLLAINGTGKVERDETDCKFCGRRLEASEYLKMEQCIEAAPHYSSDIAAAMQVVERCGDVVMTNRGKSWFVQFFRTEDDTPLGDYASYSLPEAICRAALATVSGGK